ncbi:MAG TPA: circularly permuted type 2 ATP-grasp protein [Vicinamibacterales bacterium]|nr:circularly permuted type 2 ATP-grasp protein [Vicinamibacterales bacterium]
MSDTSSARPSRSTADWNYRPPQAGHWDEALDPSGRPRPHWMRLAAALRRMGMPEFSRRWEFGQQLIRANGVTYNVYGDPLGSARPWPMDLVPLAIDGREWAHIEHAVIQRATLLNAILADLYGTHRLVRDGHIPPELVFDNPGFLRACHGIAPTSGVYLQNCAVDIARAPNGTWWVISDRTQAPSGAGYALENRLVSGRTLPAMLDQCRVRPLTDFFEVTIKALLNLAPNRPANPRVVVLSAGPNSETYFEHSFFARQWDFPLVGGGDLTVRDGRVYLKTLAGLNPVDVILRRLDDDFCDPLELRGDSLLGVPGLVQAARAGTVFVANCLGSGLVETPALMAFMPSLCREVLGEELRMPSVATWWCGQDEPRREVLEHLEKLVIKPVFPRFGQHAEFPATMSAEKRRALAARIEAHPTRFVAQEQVDLSSAPVHTHRGLEARHVVLRVLAAWDGTSYAVLPGGLTRVATGQQSLVVSMQAGGGSKDTWVIGGADDRTYELEPSPQAGFTHSTELSSRMADNLFWLGRYAERLEASARLFRVLLPALSGEAHQGRHASVDTALHFLRGLDLLPPESRRATVARQWWTLQRIVADLVFDTRHIASIGGNLRHVRRLSWEVKERLSPDTWRVLQQLSTQLSGAPPANHDRRFLAALAALDDVVIMLSAFAGLLAENPTRGYGWRFLGMGRRMERALQMIELLRVGVALAPFPDDACLEVLLQVADSSTTYRSRYLAAIRTRYVLELLLTDETNPRSVAFQAAALLDGVHSLPRRQTEASPPAEYTLAKRLRQMVRDISMDDLKRRDANGQRLALEAHLQTVRNGVSDLSEAITARYLSHSTPSQLKSF